jgi:acyl-[acyl-carrier-protein]-phospholipid O-acyltransferase/long-chain-fatty-acid--[acyl-carrier-protein] ligase
VIVDHFLKVKVFAWFLRLFDAVPISPSRAKEAIRTAADAVKEGSVVCIFPEGQLTRTGMLTELKKGFELIARLAQCPVLPVYMDSLWGSIFSFERFRYFKKKPKQFPYPVTVNFGPVIPMEQVAGDTVRAAILDLSVDAFAARDNFRRSLGQSILRALLRGGPKDQFIDLGRQVRTFSGRQLGALSFGLARTWREDWKGDATRRVGLLLPTGTMSTLFHAALVLAGRVPVCLPLRLLEMPPEERNALLAKHGIQRIVSSKPLFSRNEFPELGVDFREALAQLDPLTQLGARAAFRMLPAPVLEAMLDLGDADLDAEAAAYLTDSFHLVSRSHHGVVATVEQIDSALVVLPKDKILVQSPFHTADAQVFGLWHPLLEGSRALDRTPAAMTVDLPQLLQDQEPKIVLVDSAMQLELARVPPSAPCPVRVWLDFSETILAPEVAAHLGENGDAYCHGFAPEHLGVIVAMNTNDPNSMIPQHLPQFGNRKGTLGKPLPGFSPRSCSV